MGCSAFFSVRLSHFNLLLPKTSCKQMFEQRFVKYSCWVGLHCEKQQCSSLKEETQSVWDVNVKREHLQVSKETKKPNKTGCGFVLKKSNNWELASESSAVWLLMPANYSPEDGPVLELFLLLVQFFQKTHLSVPVYCQNWTAETLQETDTRTMLFHYTGDPKWIPKISHYWIQALLHMMS